jgi:cytochrome c oxidase subunit 2
VAFLKLIISVFSQFAESDHNQCPACRTVTKLLEQVHRIAHHRVFLAKYRYQDCRSANVLDGGNGDLFREQAVFADFQACCPDYFFSTNGLAIRRRLYMMSCLALARHPFVPRGRVTPSGERKAMEMKTPGKGSAATAAFLSLLICLLVVVTVYAFMSGKYSAPPTITRLGLEVDHQYKLTLIVTGIVFVLSQLGLAFAIFRFRDHGQRVHFTRGNNTLEILWTGATIVLFLSLGVMARHAWAASHFTGASPEAVQVEVTGNQFVWNFRYPGPDGRFGRLDATMVSASSGNPLGLDPADKAAKDDIVLPTLTVPVNHQVELLLRAQDVIHSFFVRELRLKQDAVPGMVIPMYFTATQTGQYEIVCTQLCGLGHYRMRSFMNVVSDDDYRKFIADQEQQLLPAPAPAPITPATGAPR